MGWEDLWLTDTSFASQFPHLYAISNDQNITVRDALGSSISSLSFRRNIVGPKLVEWENVRTLCDNVVLSDEDDQLVWLLTASKQFPVKSFYSAMQSVGSVPHRFLWKVKIPLRVKTFIWLILKKRILTRDVLLKRGGVCSKTCLFCGQDESINHIFFKCPLERYVWNIVSVATGLKCGFNDANFCLTDWLNGFRKSLKMIMTVGVAAVLWGIWKTQNLACFENKWPSEPIEVLHRICSFIDLWANLQKSEDAKLELQVGARLLGRIAEEVFKGATSWATWRPRLGG